jgi:hypothetical protein
MSMPEKKIIAGCRLKVIANTEHAEFELTIDVSNLPFYWNIE